MRLSSRIATVIVAIAFTLLIAIANPNPSHAETYTTTTFGVGTLPQSLQSATRASVTCTTVTVVPGDTLGNIAARYGTTWQSMAAINNIPNANLIFPGQRFATCGGASSEPGSPPVTTTSYTTKPGVVWGATYEGYSFGWCTWGAAVLSNENMAGLGNAPDWTYNARARGWSTGYWPQVGATAVFQPGYHVSNWGTSEGHVAHVVAVSGNMMEIQEMNNSYYGGWGRWDWVWIQIVPGVSFIY